MTLPRHSVEIVRPERLSFVRGGGSYDLLILGSLASASAALTAIAVGYMTKPKKE
jgi:hypothetical protein